ncbi:MAG TPA: hypothetical protein VK843_10855 [Planctomycetota bacterium]|nr:hypothetical protein [Planctomycetota bacterium]
MKTLVLIAALAVGFALAPLSIAQKKSKSESAGPDVGQIAPPIGELKWLQLGGVTSDSSLDTMRGSVVIVADYGYYCDSCVKVGVPTLNALRASNEPRDLKIIQLTAGIGDDTPEVIQKKGEELGIAGPVGIADVEGVSSPYLNMGANGNLTFAFVIGRHGGILWKGDPSRKREDYLAAVSSALNAVPCDPLPASSEFGPMIAPALRDYVLGDFQKAEIGAQTLLTKLGTKAGDENDRARKDVNALLALVEGTRKHLMEELETTGGAKQSERFQKALTNVRRVFPKGPEADRASSLEMYVTIQSDQGPTCRKWAIWYELESARPAVFPGEKNAATTKYARELAKYVKQGGVPGVDRAKQWLEAFDKLAPHK